MGLHEEIAVKRMERKAKREREAKLNEVADTVRFALEVCSLLVLMYLFIWFGCLWASI